MMNAHKKFHQSLRKTYNQKSYPIFKHIMEFVVEKEMNQEKLLNKINQLRKKENAIGLSKTEKALMKAISQSNRVDTTESNTREVETPLDKIKKFDNFGTSPELILESNTEDAVKLQ